MKTQEIRLDVETVSYMSTNMDRSIEIVANIEKDKISTILDNFKLKDIFYHGSYNVQEIVDSFGIEEITEYINGLGDRDD